MAKLFPLHDVPGDRVEQLLDALFGADRAERTASRMRAGMAPLAGFSFALCDGDDAMAPLLGTVACWPICHRGDDGVHTPLVMVGPVAVAPSAQGLGHGQRLTHAALIAADVHADGAAAMIGDAGYYERFFGFSAQHTAAWRLPGPVDRARLLARPLAGHAVPTGAGIIGPR